MRSISIVVCRAGFVNGPVRAPPVCASPRRCRPSPPLPPLPPIRAATARPPQHARSHIPFTRRPCGSARPRRAGIRVIHMPSRSFVHVAHPFTAAGWRRMAQDGTVPPRLSIPARRHGRSTLCFCDLANYHSAVLTNARPPCYAEASAGRGRPRTPPPPCRGKRTGGGPPRNPRARRAPLTARRAGRERPAALPRETNRGRTLPHPPPPCRGKRTGGGRSRKPRRPAGETDRDADAPQTPRPPRPAHRAARRKGTARRPAAGNEPGADAPATPAALPRETNRDGTSPQPPRPAVPCSPRGAPEGNGSPPKTNGLRARHRAAGGKEAACSASSCPRCARWRR